MADTVTYRHNVMEIGSLDTFFSIRGGYTNHIRDVYFIRALGECVDFSAKINEIDERMGTEISKGRLGYTRIGELPNINEEAKIQKYRGIYDQWKNNHTLTLSKVKKNDLLFRTISNALLKVEQIYKESRAGISESILKNFGVKILFWLEEKTGNCFDDWSEKSCIKIVLENVMKDQEYMFGYFLSLLGCDVLLLENKSDASVPDTLKMLSKTMILGDYGNIKLSQYVQYVPSIQEKMKEEVKAAQPVEKRENVKVVIPEHARRNKAAQPVEKRENVKVVIPEHARRNKATQAVDTAGYHRPAAPQRNNHAARIEKSFEELAQMASSIVMIAVHNNDGEVAGTGSGIMIGSNGFILTNHHVVARGRFYSVRIEDDEEIYKTDEIIKYNSSLDMAVIRISRRLKPLSIYRGGQKLVRGQKVVAIGSPLGMFNSVSDGIISGFRNIRDTDMIQFTAPISPGSSGGAVINMYGEVIGISTAGIDNGQNINLAVGYEDILMFVKGFID